MKKNTIKFPILLPMVIIIIGVLGLTISVKGQDQSTLDLSERLKAMGVPIKQVSVQNRFPLQVDIVIQSSSENTSLSMDDAWFMQLARRESTLAYRNGMKLNNYTLTIVNKKGEKIAWEKTFLYPTDLSQNLMTIGQSKLDNTATSELIKAKINFSNMNIDIFKVDSELTPGDFGQILNIQLSTSSLVTANQYLLPFLGSLNKVLDSVNSEYGTRIVLCHVRLIDSQGNILLSYVVDAETHQKQWSAIKGLTQEWYPHPQSTPIPQAVTRTPAPYPPPGNGTMNLLPYPVPTTNSDLPAYHSP